jgi:hypothetical protein
LFPSNSHLLLNCHHDETAHGDIKEVRALESTGDLELHALWSARVASAVA